MKDEADIKAIVTQARAKGYFDFADYPRLSLRMDELAELKTLLDKKKIPFGKPEIERTGKAQLTRKEASTIIKALRQGTPAQDGIAHYSVGRNELLDHVYGDLARVKDGAARVQFLNADVGQGKTHTLYMLREFAFQHGFAVSVVTLSQHDCPLYDFMTVYNQVMWGLRTADQRTKPALSNIIDRWIDDIKAHRSPERVKDIIHNDLPSNLRSSMGAYVDTQNMFRPNERNRQMILKHLSGEKTNRADMRRLGIEFRLDSENALEMLSDMAFTIRFIGFKGICILFDEAEAIHSFANSSHRAQAYNNLQHIIHQSRRCPHCYFIYATTPSFFEDHGAAEIATQAGNDAVLELDPLTPADMQSLANRISRIYSIATGYEIPGEIVTAMGGLTSRTPDMSVGNTVRRIIAALDEMRNRG